MKTSLNKAFLIALLFSLSPTLFAQGSTEYTGGFKVKLNEDGTKYFRIISWGQFWAEYNDNAPDDVSKTNLSIRRARILTFAQLNKKFMILTHFGLNSLNGENISPVGKGDSSQLFFHDFWGEYALSSDHAIGAGLHYWNGISRLNNQSTLNMMTLDNNRQSWATIGLSDQFARHIGVYFKGKFGKFQYRVSINEAVADNLQEAAVPTPAGPAVYAGRRLLGSKDAGKTFAGYFDYNFLDQESNFLPYKVGSYLGSKKVFNVGAGFFLHPSGSVVADGVGELSGEDVSIFAIDAFYDAPIGDDGSAITAYATFQNNDYGRDYTLGTTYETGNMIYTHVGYLIPGDKEKTRFQPYLSFSNRSIDAIDNNANRFGIGANAFFTGHHSKLSLEYSNLKYGDNDAVSVITLQAMVYL
ncbi:hypothetical protein ACFQ1M_08320 [Sungkyunkwania multivorans]|uniref:Short chain amide porin n=1 Tax=Sungkyunkwania multivorans TaxID=1173618 RepID=A0ABW3CYD5_9FLAO